MSKVYYFDSPFWIILVANCPSFTNCDCTVRNAEFSQIFTGEMIDNLTEQESDLFETRYILEGICSSCGEPRR